MAVAILLGGASVRDATGAVRLTAGTAMTASRSSVAMAVHNGYAYAFGGYNGTQVLDTVERSTIDKDGNLGAWEVLGSMTKPRMAAAAAVASGYVYVVGGSTDALGTDVQASVEYAQLKEDGTLGPWRATNPMTTERWKHALVASGSHLYALGGRSSTGILSDVDVTFVKTDATLDTWAKTTSMLTRREGLAAVEARGGIYALGGSDGAQVLSSGEMAGPNRDGTLSEWTALSPMSSARQGLAAVAAEDSIYVIGGKSGASTYSTLEKGTVTITGTVALWEGAGNLGTARSELGAAYSGGYLYAAGGYDGSQHLGTTEVVVLRAVPNLSSSVKTVSSATASPGQVVTYTIAITNTGTANASARLTDTLPLSLSYVPASAGAGATYVTETRTITWTGVISAATSASLSYAALVSSPLDNGTAITNTATIDNGAGTSFETSPATTTVTSSTNLSTSGKAVSTSTARPGETITYTVILTNTGNMNAAGALMTDTLPLSVTYRSGSMSASSGSAGYAGGVITWNGVVNVGTPVTITYGTTLDTSLAHLAAFGNYATINGGAGVRATDPVTVTVNRTTTIYVPILARSYVPNLSGW